jgi:hypothetical protein
MLISERLLSRGTDIGMRGCCVCLKQKNFSQIVETRYFCLFGLRSLRLEQFVNDQCCDPMRHGTLCG